MKAAPITPDEVRAMAFSVLRHGAQAYGQVPHVVHCAEVRRVVSSYGFTAPFFHVVPWLHDLVEDTSTTREEIADRFGADVADGVWAVSGMPKGAPRKVRVADAYAKIVTFGPRAAALKLADRIANARASRASLLATPSEPGLFNMYRGELPAFEAMLDAAGAQGGVFEAMRAELREVLATPVPLATDEVERLQRERSSELVAASVCGAAPRGVKAHQRIREIDAQLDALAEGKR